MPLRYYITLFILVGCTKTTSTFYDQIPTIVINVKQYGAKGDGISNDSAAFSNAMKDAKLMHLPLFIPNGYYNTNLILTADSLKIIGESQPDELLESGTIIKGFINCNSKKNILITNLGIDSRGKLANEVAALNSGYGLDSSKLYQVFSNITLLGDGYIDYKHGILCQNGGNNLIRNIIISKFYHGIAIRSSNINIENIKVISCGFTSIIVKSANSSNAHVENVNINNINIIGNPSNVYEMGGAILVQSYNNESKINNIQINNIKCTYAGIACVAVQQVNGKIEDIIINNCISKNQGDNMDRACFDFDGGSNIIVSNCLAQNSNGYGYRSSIKTQNIQVINCFEKSSKICPWIGNFNFLQLNGIVIKK